MGKKKKQTIKITGSPLQAITIGEIKQSKYGFIGTIFLFILFIGTVYYLPELFELYQEYTKKPSYPAAVNMNNTVNNTTPNNDIIDDVVNYKFSNKKKFPFENVTVSNVSYFNSTLTYEIENVMDNEVKTDYLKIFIELFDEKNRSLIEYPINISLDPNEKKLISIDVADEIASKVAAYNVDTIKENPADLEDVGP